MARSTTIEWTEMTWNPVRGCTRISEGCRSRKGTDIAEWPDEFRVREFPSAYTSSHDRLTPE